jgi:hypothetical protein
MKLSRLTLAALVIFVAALTVFAQDAQAQQVGAPAGPTTWQIIVNIIVSIVVSIPDKLVWAIVVFYAIKKAVVAGRRAELTSDKEIIAEVLNTLKGKKKQPARATGEQVRDFA